MRTNIDIDDALMAKALEAGPFKTKKEAVEAGLRLLARQAAYREILKWRGKLQWDGEEAEDWTMPAPGVRSAGYAPAPPPVAHKAAEAGRVARKGGRARR